MAHTQARFGRDIIPTAQPKSFMRTRHMSGEPRGACAAGQSALMDACKVLEGLNKDRERIETAISRRLIVLRENPRDWNSVANDATLISLYRHRKRIERAIASWEGLPPKTQRAGAAIRLSFGQNQPGTDRGGETPDDCAAVTARLLPRRPFRPPMAVTLPLPEECQH